MNKRDSVIERFAGYLVARNYQMKDVSDFSVSDDSISCNINSKRVQHSHFTAISVRDMAGNSFKVRLSFKDFDNILITGNYFPPERNT